MVVEKRPMVELLLANGAEVNAKNQEGETPLHITTQREDRLITKILLENGADPCVKNRFGKTPLDIAFNCSDKPLRKLLWASVRSYVTTEASLAEVESIIDTYP